MYGSFFSGQTKKTEYGFKLTLAGIAIEDTFYPIAFCVASKKIKDFKQAQMTLAITHKFVQDLEKEHNLEFGKWYLSVDSCYSSDELIDYVKGICIDIICVCPRKIKYSKTEQNRDCSLFTQYISTEYQIISL